jgi:hypothetical protein
MTNRILIELITLIMIMMKWFYTVCHQLENFEMLRGSVGIIVLLASITSVHGLSSFVTVKVA